MKREFELSSRREFFGQAAGTKPPIVRNAMKPLAIPTLSDNTWTLLKPRPNLPVKSSPGRFSEKFIKSMLSRSRS